MPATLPYPFLFGFSLLLYLGLIPSPFSFGALELKRSRETQTCGNQTKKKDGDATMMHKGEGYDNTRAEKRKEGKKLS
jgi:hypothetical protein